MSSNAPKTLALVISAIKKMQSRVGPNPREILNYISSVYDVPEAAAKRQVLAALKRGTMQGILQETDGHYSIPCRENDLGAVAIQELGLLNLACRKRKQQQRKKKAMSHCGGGGGAMKKKSKKRGRSRGKSSRKKQSMKSSSCGHSGRRKRKSKSKKRKSRSKYDCGTKKSKKSKRSKKRKSKKGRRDCVCPDKNPQRSDTKSEGCPVKSEKEKKKESNKCMIDFDDMTSTYRKFSKTRSQSQSRSRGQSRSRSSMYY